MQQGDSQQQQQQSPRGGVSKLSFLGHYPSSPCHGFSILGPLEQQQQPQPHFHHQVQMATATAAPPLQNLLHQGFLLTTGPTQPGYNLQLTAAPQMLLEDLIKLSPPGSPPVPMNTGPSAPASYNVNLVSLLEQKTEQLRTLVRSFSHNAGSGVLQPHAAMAAARIASSISQIALAAVGVVPNATHSLLPDLQQQHGLFSSNNSSSSTLQVATAAVRNPLPVVEQQHKQHQDSGAAAFNLEVAQLGPNKNGSEAREPLPMVPPVAPTEDGDSGAGSRDEDDDGEAEDLVPGSYDLVEMNAVEILAEHTHFCDKCGKGFKRDANLRMHMRGHGEQYKSPAALARPDKFSQDNAAVVRPRRYSCPYAGCKRNKKHRKFQPLKTVLCVKNHYRRSHCPKSLTCSKCKSKKFSVVADLKTHEKHCGRDKWQCSCGTTFSRKDKLLGHIGLFQGHTPALPLQDTEASTSTAPNSEQAMNEDVGRSDLVGMASG